MGNLGFNCVRDIGRFGFKKPFLALLAAGDESLLKQAARYYKNLLVGLDVGGFDQVAIGDFMRIAAPLLFNKNIAWVFAVVDFLGVGRKRKTWQVHLAQWTAIEGVIAWRDWRGF